MFSAFKGHCDKILLNQTNSQFLAKYDNKLITGTLFNTLACSADYAPSFIRIDDTITFTDNIIDFALNDNYFIVITEFCIIFGTLDKFEIIECYNLKLSIQTERLKNIVLNKNNKFICTYYYLRYEQTSFRCVFGEIANDKIVIDAQNKLNTNILTKIALNDNDYYIICDCDKISCGKHPNININLNSRISIKNFAPQSVKLNNNNSFVITSAFRNGIVVVGTIKPDDTKQDVERYLFEKPYIFHTDSENVWYNLSLNDNDRFVANCLSDKERLLLVGNIRNKTINEIPIDIINDSLTHDHKISTSYLAYKSFNYWYNVSINNDDKFVGIYCENLVLIGRVNDYNEIDIERINEYKYDIKYITMNNDFVIGVSKDGVLWGEELKQVKYISFINYADNYEEDEYSVIDVDSVETYNDDNLIDID